MEFIEQKIKGVFEVVMNPFRDERGYFMRSFDRELFEGMGLNKEWVQENHSYSEKKGIIRGLHCQRPPYAETKLIRCTRGAVLDVFVDIRCDSPSFGTWGALELSERNFKSLFIPEGFAHGFCVLEDHSEILYKVDSCYSPAHEIGIIWNDLDLNIPWPVKIPYLSDKDKLNMTLKEFIERYKSIKV